jgi:pimeloyl-ACP methyl ester carboxylesterase
MRPKSSLSSTVYYFSSSYSHAHFVIEIVNWSGIQYGTIKVYEWGPETGRKVLLIHGISTPCISLGPVSHRLVAKDCRVMLLDLFGRGYSDGVGDLPYDSRLYSSQILIALTSSPLAWTPDGFSIIGYSLGGGIAADFAAYFPDLVKSVVLLAPAGLIRDEHFGWFNRFLFGGWIRESRFERIIKSRLGAGPMKKPVEKRGDASHPTIGDELKGNRDPKYEKTVLVEGKPEIMIMSVVKWQLDHHEGFVKAFISSIRFSSTSGKEEIWRMLGMRSDKVLVMVGTEDPIILPGELREDAVRAMGGDKALEWRVVEGGHEFPIESAEEVVDEISKVWGL